VVGLAVRAAHLQDREPLVERPHEADAIGELVDGADATARDGIDPIGSLVPDRPRGELDAARAGRPSALLRLQPATDLFRLVPQPLLPTLLHEGLRVGVGLSQSSRHPRVFV
jgi:hypothetical protein